MTLFICGDSTAASYSADQAPLTGWGQVLPELIRARVDNRAMAGRSTKSFLAEGRLQRIEGEIRAGDLLLIQFAHNDESELVWRHTDPWTSFSRNLEIFLDTAVLHGAQPVLLTPICCRCWKDGRLQPSHGDYPAAMRMLASRRGVPMIDLYRQSFDLVQSMGEDESRSLFMHLEKGAYPAYPDGQTDDTHTRRAGALAFARLAADGLKDFGLAD